MEYASFEKPKEPEYRNLRSKLMMLAALFGLVGSTVASVLRWEWWWLAIGVCLVLALAVIDKELDKPRRPAP